MNLERINWYQAKTEDGLCLIEICQDSGKDVREKVLSEIRHRVNVHSDLVSAIRSLLEWIDAVPKDLQLPVMPGVDRDWIDEILAKAEKKETEQQ